jgi:ureidoglycolate amidohydrolase
MPLRWPARLLALACAAIALSLGPAARAAAAAALDPRALDVSGEAVVAQLLELARFSDDPRPAVTRVLFTGALAVATPRCRGCRRPPLPAPADRPSDRGPPCAEADVAARRHVKALMAAAGLAVAEDTMGSIFGTWAPSDAAAAARPAVLTGSHCDAIPGAGAYDGTLGVLGGVAALTALRSAGFRPARPLVVVMFTSEEPTRFGLSCLGSRAMAGALTPVRLAALRDANGTSFLEAARAAGAGGGAADEAAALAAARLREARVHAFLELHIEQGPELEAAGVQIGAVTGIAAPAALRVTFRGGGGHAGALLMRRRADASLAAAELALAAELLALGSGAEDTVATAGRWEVAPNAVNSVPRESRLELDVRDIDVARRDGVVAALRAEAAAIAARRGVALELELLSSDPPVAAGAEVLAAVEAAADAAGFSRRRMVSRAYHDSTFMAQVTPRMGMIFVPCRGGVSHRPDEFAAPADVERGVRVLAAALAALAGEAPAEATPRAEL